VIALATAVSGFVAPASPAVSTVSRSAVSPAIEMMAAKKPKKVAKKPIKKVVAPKKKAATSFATSQRDSVGNPAGTIGKLGVDLGSAVFSLDGGTPNAPIWVALWLAFVAKTFLF